MRLTNGYFISDQWEWAGTVVVLSSNYFCVFLRTKESMFIAIVPLSKSFALFVVQLLSHVRLFAVPWTTAQQASLSFTISWSLCKPMSVESVMPSNHLIFCCSLLHLPSIFPRIRVFSNELVLHIKWPKYWSFSFSISTSNWKSILNIILNHKRVTVFLLRLGIEEG